ncbi:MAG: flagellar motor switch protein FliN [Aliihoeflea sp.]
MDPNSIPALSEEEDQLSAAIDELRDVLHDGADTEPGLGMLDPGLGMSDPALGLSNPGMDFSDPGLGMGDQGLGGGEMGLGMADQGMGGSDAGFGMADAGFASVASATGQGAAPGKENHAVIMDIPVDVQIVLGSTEMPVSELMALQKGSTVALDRKIGEPVDVVVNGRKIAAGEVTVLDSDPSRFGIKLTHIVDSSRKA